MRRFRWTPLRRKLVELLVRGWSHAGIASELKVHRNTVRNLCKRPEVQQRIAQRTTEWITRTKLHRLHEMTAATDAAAQVAFIQLREAEREKTPKLATVRRARMALKSLRKQSRATRKELDSIQVASEVKVSSTTSTRAALAALLLPATAAADRSPKAAGSLVEASEERGAVQVRSVRRKRLERRAGRL